MPTFFVSGIDTDIGKTIVSGLLAKAIQETGCSIITQKLVQTGCEGIAEDLLTHRKLMGKEPFGLDRTGHTCPFVYKLPASPHLAAEVEGRPIDVNTIDQTTLTLQMQYPWLLIEGAGGLMVPITRDYTILDFLRDRKLPLVLVTSSRLGSINHTLLSLEAVRHANIPLAGIIYKHTLDETPEIAADSLQVITDYLTKHQLNAPMVELPWIEDPLNPPGLDFQPLIEKLKTF